MSDVLSDNDAKRYIAANLERLLDATGMSQADLARKTGTTPMRISHYVNQSRMPGAGMMARLAEALDVSVDALLTRPPKKVRQTA